MRAGNQAAVVGAGIAVLAVIVGATPVTCQTATAVKGDAVAKGRVVPSVVSHADTGERYAIYLPTHYDPARRWPTLLVMDPRGRALLAMGRFQEAAERDGYIVLSSYNTVSDSTADPNTRAVNAMLADLFERFAADPKRVYFAGFSGTARIAWSYAYELNEHVAGILAFAAGLPWRGVTALVQLKQRATFAWFGAAGTADFNYDEVRSLDGALDSSSAIAHRVEYFDGPHGWPPTRVCGEALDWMELQAMKRGLRPRDDSMVGAWITEGLTRARAAEDSGDTYTAYLRYRALHEDVEGLRDVPDASAKIAALGRSPAVQRRRARDAQLSADFDSYTSDAFPKYLKDLDGSKKPLSLAASLGDLRIPALERQAGDSAHDRLASQAAQRELALVLANTAFYWPRKYLAAKDPARALVVLDVAHEIEPTAWGVCFDRAIALAQLGRTAEAVVSLRCAAAGGQLTPSDLADEHAFDAMRADTGFASITASVAASSPSAGRPQSK